MEPIHRNMAVEYKPAIERVLSPLDVKP